MYNYNILDKISNKNELKDFPISKIELLCEEIRHKLIDTVTKTGGHLSSNLGVVELTVALHTSFNTPQDTIIFDVGHQSYTHKILTERYNKLNTIRQENGISGFTNRNESVHDAYISGHSGISISVGCGIAHAKKIKSDNSFTISVIGDGALTSGIAYEGLNNVDDNLKNFIIILNDNKMSISEMNGSMARYLDKIRNSRSYFLTKYKMEKLIRKTPIIGDNLTKVLSKSKNTVKHLIYDNNFFEDLGFKYIGPIDGHNINDILNSFYIAKMLHEPVFIHIVTKKGKGYESAEINPITYHGVAKNETHKHVNENKTNSSFSEVFGKKLTELAKKDEKICAVTASMSVGTGLHHFEKNIKDRFFDVTIAEQHAVSFCGGLASQGLKPVFAVYSTFLQRAFDQVIHDINIQNMPVLFAIDRVGIIGEDGETHQGIFDLSILLCLDNFIIFCPSNYKELEYTLENTINNLKCPIAIRYPRGSEDEYISGYVPTGKDFDIIKFAQNKNLVVLTYGRLFSECLKSIFELKINGINVDLIKINKIWPISYELINNLNKYSQVIIFEETIKNGGIGQKIKEILNKEVEVIIHAIESSIIKQSTVSNSLKNLGLDKNAICDKVEKRITIEN